MKFLKELETALGLVALMEKCERNGAQLSIGEDGMVLLAFLKIYPLLPPDDAVVLSAEKFEEIVSRSVRFETVLKEIAKTDERARLALLDKPKGSYDA